MSREDVARLYASEIRLMVNNSWREAPMSREKAIDTIVKLLDLDVE